MCAWQHNFNFGCRYSATARRHASFANATPSAAESMQHSKVHLQLPLLAACNILWIIATQCRTTIHPIYNGHTHTHRHTNKHKSELVYCHWTHMHVCVCWWRSSWYTRCRFALAGLTVPHYVAESFRQLQRWSGFAKWPLIWCTQWWRWCVGAACEAVQGKRIFDCEGMCVRVCEAKKTTNHEFIQWEVSCVVVVRWSPTKHCNFKCVCVYIFCIRKHMYTCTTLWTHTQLLQSRKFLLLKNLSLQSVKL